ncbi:MAG: TolC family protein [Candidatus Aminicenantes bacterium]|nr:MAG: TolC family protein [Candidatus Aminicenantes bacterium]
MLGHKKTISVLSILFLFSSVWGQQKEKSLSLEDCIVSALQNNLGVAVEILNPQLADISVSLAKQKFLPQLGFSLFKRETNTASFSWIEAAEQVTTKFSDYAAQLTQEIPTGGNFSVTLYSYREDTNRKFQTINPRYGSSLSFNFNQPLLRDFGFKMSRREIIIAQNNMDISETLLKGVLLDTVYNVEEAYWNLVYSIENLNVKKQALDLARDLLNKNKREVEIGTLAPIEILSAEAEVATREAEILQAEVLVKNSEDRLRTVINIAAKEGDFEGIIPTEEPAFEKKDISLDGALLLGMENRPDLQGMKLDLKNKEMDLSYAKNQLLPNLSLEASYWSPGISGTEILYKDGNPLTENVIGEIPGVASDALKDAFNFRYKNWSVRLTFSIPVETIFSRAQYAQARVSQDQAMLRLKNQEQEAFLEIRNAVRTVQTDYKRVQAYKVARELAEKKLEAEEKKLKVGLTTNYLVLQHQRDLADARGAELRAIIDYNLSLARMDKVLGTTLKNKNIKFSKILESRM